MKKKILSLLVAFIAAGALSGCGKPPASGGTKETEKCGNGTVDAGEKCDKKIAAGEPGACPTAETCQDDSKELSGEADKCTAECVAPKCGNGDVDAGETCDTKGKGDQKCVQRAACEAKATTDGDHKWVYSGKYSDCTAKCEEVAYECKSAEKDGFCPASCTSATDADCVAYGGKCETNEQCKGGTCGTLKSKFGLESLDKYCLPDCTTNAAVCSATADKSKCFPVEQDNSSGAVVTTKSLCLKVCTDSSQCSGDGMDCVIPTGLGSGVCTYNPRIADAKPGAGCDTTNVTANCGADGVCLTDEALKNQDIYMNGGLCSAECGEKSLDKLDCPKGSTCSAGGLCLKECQDDTTCGRASLYCRRDGTCFPRPKSCKNDPQCDATKGEVCADNQLPHDPTYKTCVQSGGPGNMQKLGALCKIKKDCQGGGLLASCQPLLENGKAICSIIGCGTAGSPEAKACADIGGTCLFNRCLKTCTAATAAVDCEGVGNACKKLSETISICTGG